MNKPVHSPISAEKLASYLDGNLPVNELRQLSELINGDKLLREIVDECDSIDLAMDSFAVNSPELPDELKTDDFTIPFSEANLFLHGYSKDAAGSVACFAAPPCACEEEMETYNKEDEVASAPSEEEKSRLRKLFDEPTNKD